MTHDAESSSPLNVLEYRSPEPTPLPWWAAVCLILIGLAGVGLGALLAVFMFAISFESLRKGEWRLALKGLLPSPIAAILFGYGCMWIKRGIFRQRAANAEVRSAHDDTRQGFPHK